MTSRVWTKRSAAAALEVTCALLAGLHIILMPPSSLTLAARGIRLPKNSRRHVMPQFDESIHDYEEASLKSEY